MNRFHTLRHHREGERGVSIVPRWSAHGFAADSAHGFAADDAFAPPGPIQAEAHLESRELPIYELVVARADGKLGPQLRQSAVDCNALVAAVRGGRPLPAREPNEPPPCGAMRGPARVLAGGIPMPQFATMVTNILAVGNGPAAEGRRVIDKTGLTGRFAFTLAWTPEQMPTAAPPPGVPPIDPNGPSFFTALQEQLGLKLESAKGSVDVVVIDSVERPTPD